MKPLSEEEPCLLVIQIKIQAVCLPKKIPEGSGPTGLPGNPDANLN